ncbi:replication protein A 14 kDa subunit-like [Megalopta genalis]|uniref:replication protein A 14 kDa subunit-like n=1 Tax=Megalopta genalis TaxID=115081 RepID=UPI003FD313B0
MARPRVNGRHLAQNVGEEVILLGTIRNKSSNGTNIEIMTTDGVQVSVTLSVPIDGNAEGYIELRGKLNSKSTMACSDYILLPSDVVDKFDIHQYNHLVNLLKVMQSDANWWELVQYE